MLVGDVGAGALADGEDVPRGQAFYGFAQRAAAYVQDGAEGLLVGQPVARLEGLIADVGDQVVACRVDSGLRRLYRHKVPFLHIVIYAILRCWQRMSGKVIRCIAGKRVDEIRKYECNKFAVPEKPG